MTISKILDLVEEKLKEVQLIQKKATVPACEGSLVTKHAQGVIRYYQHIDKKLRYISLKEEKLIKDLQQKEYCMQIQKTAEEETAKLLKIQKMLQQLPDTDKVFLQLPEEKRNLIQPLENGIDEDIKKQFNLLKEKNRNQNTTYRTLNGENVRSKSELIIADRLKAAGVSYVYEPPVLLDDALEIWHPDFLVLNERTGVAFYWEYFGLLDKKDYCDNFHYKLERYAEIGVFIGKDLIVTTETSEHPLSTVYLDKLIENYLK